MNKYSFTYIIGYRHNLERFNNLKRALDWVNGFSNVDVIVIEQDKHSKISHLNIKARHIFLKSDKAYNRSWAFNVALKYAKSETIVFSDSDLVMEPNQFIEAIKQLDKFEMVNPYKSVVDLQPHESNLPFEQIFKIDRPGRGENDNQKINLCGGICIFRKAAIYKIAGWNEDFKGWGAEDDFLTHKVKNFLTWTEMPYRCYHLYHSRVQPDMKLYQNNLQLLNNLCNLKKEDLAKTINLSFQKIGMKNLYDTF